MKDFHFEDYYRGVAGQKDKVKMRFYGAEAFIELKSTNIPVKGLKLEFYDISGKTNVIVEANDCLYDQTAASSTNQLRVTSGDGGLQIKGTGFLWRRNEDRLIISNDTHAVIQRKQAVEINSRGSDFNQTEKRVTFWGNVRTHDPEMDMVSEWLAIKLRDTNNALATFSSESRLENIVALTNVSVVLPEQQTETHSQRAEYRFENGQERIELTGDPTWKRAGREGHADRLWFDRSTKLFLAQGNSYAKLPSGDMMKPGDLFQSLSQATNQVATTTDTNEFVEIRAEESRLWTNGAVFQGLVRANEVGGSGEPVRLSCGRMTATNSTPTARFDTITLVDDVVVQQGETNIHSSRLDYSKTLQTAKFSGKVTWNMGPQSGAADMIRLNLEHHEMGARTNAMLYLSLDKTAFTIMPSLASTNTAGSRQPRFLKILCNEYDWQPGLAIFRGDVRATELSGETPVGTLACAQLIVKLSTNGFRLENLLAETNVVYEVADSGSTNQSFRKLTCERLVGEAENGTAVQMVAEQNVQMEFKAGTAFGDKLVYSIPQEHAELTGNPRVESAAGPLYGSVIVIDLKTQLVTVPHWKVPPHKFTNPLHPK